MSLKELRFRQVHLDFHTSEAIKGIGEYFDAEEFASTLEKARVNSINCFARGHHGWLYYDSPAFPERIHPHLANKNLLKEQIEACHARGIRVPIYITVQWDHYTAVRHPEWLSVTTEGKLDGTGPYEAGFYRHLCLNSPYRDFLKKHTQEVLEMFDTDGLWFDIMQVIDCSCQYCMAGMKQAGLKPHRKADRRSYALEMMNEFMQEMTAFVRQFNKDCTIFYNAGHIQPRHRAVKKAFTHWEIESLPSGDWGYMHFPMTVRYVRTLGLDHLGMTGKFHTMWGDFHSFKNQAALEFECFQMLAQTSKCSIGDQLPPHGKICADTYKLIGSVYKQVEAKEPWCRGAKAVTEIGVLSLEERGSEGRHAIPAGMKGVTRMLQEAAYQFNIVDSQSNFNLYKLLILPDELLVDKKLAAKIDAYVKKGGAVLATFESGMNEEKDKFLLSGLGVKLKDKPSVDLNGQLVRGKYSASHAYVDYIVPKGKIGKGLAATEHVMYMRGVEVKAEKGAKVLAKVTESWFDRDYRHFCSHRQTPSSGKTDGAAIVQNGKMIYFCHPIFNQYQRNAPLWCKKMVLNAVEMLIRKKLVSHNGPSTVIATLNEQKAEKRQILHLLHYIPERRSQNIDIIEDVIPLYQIELIVQTGRKVKKVECVPQGRRLEFVQKDGQVVFELDELRGHQMISLQF